MRRWELGKGHERDQKHQMSTHKFSEAKTEKPQSAGWDTDIGFPQLVSCLHFYSTRL